MDFKDLLLRDRVITDTDATLTALTGGVSSEIYRVDEDSGPFVVKRALARLKVQEDWFADVDRNRCEVAYLRYVHDLIPEAVPEIRAQGDGYFAMEYFSEGFVDWKALLLQGQCVTDHAVRAGSIIGTVHRHSSGDARARSEFDTPGYLRALRIEPYLRTTAQRHPALQARIQSEANRLESWAECLVHGDYSPKNLLVSDDRMVILDCEVACYSDPAFDVAFLLNHLHLKALYRCPDHELYAGLIDAAWDGYRQARGWSEGSTECAALESRLTPLLLMLMLARVDGKSPAEYLTDPDRQALLRRFVERELRGDTGSLAPLSRRWFEQLDEFAASI